MVQTTTDFLRLFVSGLRIFMHLWKIRMFKKMQNALQCYIQEYIKYQKQTGCQGI